MKFKKKGFTLIEMIIVIAIIGVLLGLLIPSWMNYIANSRLKTQNNNSRIVFNAAQTIAQEYSFSERKLEDSEKIIGDGDFFFFWDGENGMILNADGTPLNGADPSAKSASQLAFERDFARKINKIFDGSDTSIYKIYINDYLVQSVASARSTADRYIGSFPEPLEERSEGSVSVQFYTMY